LCQAQQKSTPPRKKQERRAENPIVEALRQELLRMRDADQAVRVRMNDERWQSEATGREMIMLDAANTKRLLEIISVHGFPGIELVGRDGAEAAFTMVLHSPSIELQKKSLSYIKKAWRRGEAPPEAVAGLTDTILHHQGKPQIYGTRFDIVGGKLVLGKIKDASRLEARRAKLGLTSMSEYIKQLEEMYKMPVEATGILR
jgi:hypothetical protein